MDDEPDRRTGSASKAVGPFGGGDRDLRHPHSWASALTGHLPGGARHSHLRMGVTAWRVNGTGVPGSLGRRCVRKDGIRVLRSPPLALSGVVVRLALCLDIGTLEGGPLSDDDNNLDIQDRLAKVASMHQQPKDRLWAAIAVLIVIALLSGGITAYYAERTIDFHQTDREAGDQRGAVDCLQVVIDDDRNFGLPSYCARPEIILYFPPEVCEVYFEGAASCGDRWQTP